MSFYGLGLHVMEYVCENMASLSWQRCTSDVIEIIKDKSWLISVSTITSMSSLYIGKGTWQRNVCKSSSGFLIWEAGHSMGILKNLLTENVRFNTDYLKISGNMHITWLYRLTVTYMCIYIPLYVCTASTWLVSDLFLGKQCLCCQSIINSRL